MKKRIIVIMPRDGVSEQSARFRSVLRAALSETEPVFLYSAAEAAGFFGHRRERERNAAGRAAAEAALAETEALYPLLFAVELGRDGVNLEFWRLMKLLRSDSALLENCVGGIITDGDGALYTKAISRQLAFTANAAGCAFVGRPLVEGTGTLSNFSVIAKNLAIDEAGAYRKSAEALVQELLEFCGRQHAGRTVAKRAERGGRSAPKLLVLHASVRRSSNTLALWRKTAEHLDGIRIQELSLLNGTLYDCAGCPYRTCLHFGEKGSCFYGGVMTEEVYPAVREADGIVMLCANYNDALSANLTAFVNRLTALFRQMRFYDKALFGIVVSGYSGGDIVAEQLIGALNMNKSFYLPGHFALLETANNAGQAVTLPGIGERTAAFAANIRGTLLHRRP